MAVVAHLYSPGLPRYTLTPEMLTIDDRFYPVTVKAAEVDIARVSVVDLTSDKNWRPSMRTNGFSNSHYHAGWFRAVNGQRARMYWTDGKGVVILPPNGSGVPVLLEVRDPGKFIEELRSQWQSPRADVGGATPSQ
jgi:hypothetical protein